VIGQLLYNVVNRNINVYMRLTASQTTADLHCGAIYRLIRSMNLSITYDYTYVQRCSNVSVSISLQIC